MDVHAEVAFEATHDDWIAVVERQILSSAFFEDGLRAQRRNTLTAAAIVVPGFFGLGVIGQREPGSWLAGGLALALPVAGCAVVMVLLSGRRKPYANRAKKHIESSIRRGTFPGVVLGRHEVRLGIAGVQISAGGQTSTTGWTASTRVERDDQGSVWVLWTETALLRVPGRAFATEAARVKFIEAARGLIGTNGGRSIAGSAT